MILSVCRNTKSHTVKNTKENLRNINARKLAKIARRGPAAWNIAQDHERIRCVLIGLRRPYLSMRRTAGLFGVSHHTLLSWEKVKLLSRVRSKATGVHSKFKVSDLLAFVDLLRDRVLEYPSPIDRFGQQRSYPFAILRKSFYWASAEKTLTPREIASRIGCHPSTVIRAIAFDEVKARRKSSKRWEIRRLDWQKAFISILKKSKNID